MSEPIIYDDWPTGKWRNTLTACLIVKDEQERLPACLESIKGIWDQLVVVDTGSTDETVNIAKAYGAQVEHFEWCDDFSAARNYCETFATGDYIFWIDADETLIEGHDRIREIVIEGKPDGVRPQCVMRRDEYGNVDGGHLRQELLRRRGSGKWLGKIHECFEDRALGTVELGIVYEHAKRSRGTVPDEYFPQLRKAVSGHLYPRELFYLAKEHIVYGNYAEAAACAQLVLDLQKGFITDRAHAALIKGDALRALEDYAGSHKAYLRAIQEYDQWAEPFFALASLLMHVGQPKSAVIWAYAAVHQVGDRDFMPIYDHAIYRWKRYALLAQCLETLKRYDEALPWAEIAAEEQPGDKQIVAMAVELRQRVQEMANGIESENGSGSAVGIGAAGDPDAGVVGHVRGGPGTGRSLRRTLRLDRRAEEPAAAVSQ